MPSFEFDLFGYFLKRLRKKFGIPGTKIGIQIVTTRHADETATASPIKGNYFLIFHSHLHTHPMASDLFHCGFHYRPRVFRLLGPISEDRGVSSVLSDVDRNLLRPDSSDLGNDQQDWLGR